VPEKPVAGVYVTSLVSGSNVAVPCAGATVRVSASVAVAESTSLSFARTSIVTGVLSSVAAASSTPSGASLIGSMVRLTVVIA